MTWTRRATYQPEAREKPKVKPAPVTALRESSISTLAGQGVLSVDQLSAALRFRDLWQLYITQSSPSRAFEAERVDYAYRHQGRGVGHLDAKKELSRIRFQVGTHLFQLLKRTCGDGYHIRDLYRSRRERDSAVDLLRVALDEMAAMGEE